MCFKIFLKFYTFEMFVFKYELLFIILIHFTEGYRIQPPIIELGSSIDIKTGMNLSVRCEGKHPLTWYTPRFSTEIEQENSTHIENIFNSKENKYESIYNAIQLEYYDTGCYQCCYTGKDCEEEENGVCLYIFVNDANHLFLTESDEAYMYYGRTGFIPCRTTVSNVNVTLWRVHDEEIIRQYDFDPTKGFIIPQPNESFHTLFSCRAKYGNKLHHMMVDVKYFDEASPLEPVIEVNNEFPMINSTISLNCSVKIEQGDFAYIEWLYPNNSSERKEHMYFDRFFISSELVIHHAQINDGGLYQCFAIDHSGKEYITSRLIKVYESPMNPYLNLTTTNSQIKKIKLESVEFTVCIQTFLHWGTIKTYWIKDGMPLRKNKRYEMNSTNYQANLKINLLKLEDSGLYTLIANAENISANISIYLYVFESPKKEPGKGEIAVIIFFVILGIALFCLSFLLVKKIKKEKQEKRELELLNQALFNKGQIEMYNPEIPLEDQIELLPYDHKWEFPKEQLKLGKTLGQGAFGRVVKAEAFGIERGKISTTVAVKMLKGRADVNQRKALMAELKILIHLGCHINIVNLLGAVTKNIIQGELMIIIEYCYYGNLRNYLLRKQLKFIDQLDPKTDAVIPTVSSKSAPTSPGIENIEHMAATYENALHGQTSPKKTDQAKFYWELASRQSSYKNEMDLERTKKMVSMEPSGNCSDQSYISNSDLLNAEIMNEFITTCDLLCFAFQCAYGMEYLSSRKLIHRDLAARNVLLTKNNVVKICDFGLARDCYKYSNYVRKGDGPLPIKWMAIESIRDKVFTTKSDVWSFGILLWELFTLGGDPYPGIDINYEFYKKLTNGYRMDKPNYAPKSIYEIMQNCWKSIPMDRPDFSELLGELGKLLDDSVKMYYIELNQQYSIANNESSNDYIQMEEGEIPVHYVNVTSLQKNSNMFNDNNIKITENNEKYCETNEVKTETEEKIKSNKNVDTANNRESFARSSDLLTVPIFDNANDSSCLLIDQSPDIEDDLTLNNNYPNTSSDC